MTSAWVLFVLSLSAGGWVPAARFDTYAACATARDAAHRERYEVVCLARPDAPPAHPAPTPIR